MPHAVIEAESLPAAGCIGVFSPGVVRSGYRCAIRGNACFLFSKSRSANFATFRKQLFYNGALHLTVVSVIFYDVMMGVRPASG